MEGTFAIISNEFDINIEETVKTSKFCCAVYTS